MTDDSIEALEREKIIAEISKLKIDNSLGNRMFTTIVSFSAVLIALSQIWMAHQQGTDQHAQADRDEELKKVELHIRKVESGLKLSQFAIDERSFFSTSSVDDQIRAVRLVQALLPIDEAKSMLNAMGKMATQADVLSVVETGKQQLNQESLDKISVAPHTLPPTVPRLSAATSQPSPAEAPGCATDFLASSGLCQSKIATSDLSGYAQG